MAFVPRTFMPNLARFLPLLPAFLDQCQPSNSLAMAMNNGKPTGLPLCKPIGSFFKSDYPDTVVHMHKQRGRPASSGPEIDAAVFKRPRSDAQQPEAALQLPQVQPSAQQVPAAAAQGVQHRADLSSPRMAPIWPMPCA